MNRISQNFIKHPMPAAFVVDGCSSDEVAISTITGRKQTQPFYIFDMDQAYRHIQRFRDQMPRVKLFYAMKANDSEMMVRLAVALGLGFDCASPGQISKIRNLNVSPKSIIYAVPTKTPEQMVFARQAGVRHTTFDSSSELKKLKQYWPDAKSIIYAMPTKSSEQMTYARKTGVKHTTFDTSYELKKLKEYWPNARLLLRIRVESVSQIPGDKFGCDYETEAVELLEEAASLRLRVVGIAFHVGCVCSTIESYVTGLRHARALFDHEVRAGRRMKIVNIGGGFASDRINRIDQVSKVINNAIEDLFPDPSVQIIAEPGRYVCDSAFTLYCSINNTRRVNRKDKAVNMVYLNDGVYGTIRYSENYHKLTKLQVYLPRCTLLDWLVFENHGAYTIAFSTRFSSLPIPLIRPVISMDLWKTVKDCEVYTTSDIITHPNVSTPLPLALPTPLNKNETYEHANISTLLV